MRPYKPLDIAEVQRRLEVDVIEGRCYWRDPTKYHSILVGEEAGNVRAHARENGPPYWHIGFGGLPYKRAYIVFLVYYGYWPKMVDHIDGNSLNDRASNLREATKTENNWNHRTRKKPNSHLPMGVRTLGNKFQARIACNKKTHYLGVYETPEAAQAVYVEKRKELFGAFSGM